MQVLMKRWHDSKAMIFYLKEPPFCFILRVMVISFFWLAVPYPIIISFFNKGTIIVPYRNRADHLERFLRWMHPFLQAQNVSKMMIFKNLFLERIEIHLPGAAELGAQGAHLRTQCLGHG